MGISGLRERLTYANVIATLALFLALGGGTIAVATALKKNSVKAKQIAPNAVGSSEVKPGAVTGSEVNEATLGEVPSAANATNATNAQNAQNAQNATNATNATNADTVGGNRVVEINYKANASTGAQTILDLAGVQLVASCAASANTNLNATTTKAGSSAFVSGTAGDDANDTDGIREVDSGNFDNGEFDVGDTLDLDGNIGDVSADNQHGFFGYFAPDGSTVTAYFVLDEFFSDSCHVNGFAIGG